MTPKLLSDIYFIEKSSKLKILINNHLSLVKQVGRINNILKEKETNQNTIEILALNEKITLNIIWNFQS